MRGSLVALGIAVAAAAAAVVVPLTVLDRSVAGTPVAGAVPPPPTTSADVPRSGCTGDGQLVASGARPRRSRSSRTRSRSGSPSRVSTS